MSRPYLRSARPSRGPDAAISSYFRFVWALCQEREIRTGAGEHPVHRIVIDHRVVRLRTRIPETVDMNSLSVDISSESSADRSRPRKIGVGYFVCKRIRVDVAACPESVARGLHSAPPA